MQSTVIIIVLLQNERPRQPRRWDPRLAARLAGCLSAVRLRARLAVAAARQLPGRVPCAMLACQVALAARVLNQSPELLLALAAVIAVVEAGALAPVHRAAARIGTPPRRAWQELLLAAYAFACSIAPGWRVPEQLETPP